ncbi:MAG TPA: hypothetical protein VGF45_24805 [Polyangia bacterium]
MSGGRLVTSSRLLALSLVLVGVDGCSCERRDDAAATATATKSTAEPVVTISIEAVEGDVCREDAAGVKTPVLAGGLRPGDVVTAAENGRARVRLADGREILIGPGTRLRITDAGQTGVSVALESGSIVSRRAGDAATDSDISLSVLTPFGITRIPAAPGAVDITIDGERLSVAVELGGVTFVDRAGRALSAAAGERIEVTVGGAQLLAAGSQGGASEGDEGSNNAADARLLPDRATGDLVLPTARKLRIYADRLGEVTLTWPPAFSRARIEVSRDPAGKDVIVSGRTRVPRFTLNPPREGNLYWRVTGDAKKVLRGHARFHQDRGRSVLDLAHPENVVTERSEGTKVYFQGTRPALTFTFAKQQRAQRYRVQVFRAGALGQAVFEKEVVESRCPLPPGLLGEGNYLWHAQGLDETGRVLGGGRLNKLEIVYENALNTLAIGRPRSGDVVVGPDVPVSGVAPLGDKLFVNGHPAPTDEKGRFELRVERAETLIFKLVGRDGTESYWVRRLRMGS